MSATIAAAATAATATIGTLIVAIMPEARDVLSPVYEGGSEYTVVASSLLLSLPALALLTILAVLGRE